jgi:hypothetical protein
MQIRRSIVGQGQSTLSLALEDKHGLAVLSTKDVNGAFFPVNICIFVGDRNLPNWKFEL